MRGHASRRRVLAALAGAAVATAGCGRQAQEAAASVDYPETPDPTFRRWLPAPRHLPGHADGYDAIHLRLGQLLADDDLPDGGLPDDAAELRNTVARPGRDPLGIDPERIREVVKIDLVDATMLLGTFEADVVQSRADRAGYHRTGRYREYDRYERRDRPYALAVGPEAVIQSRHDAAATVIRRVLDAAAGDRARYHEVDAGFERLSDELGGTLSWIHPGGELDTPEGAVRSANGQDFVGSRAFFVQLYRFEDAEAATQQAVRDAVTGGGAVPPQAPLDVTVDGRIGRAEWARDVEALYDEDTPLAPIVAWGFRFDEPSEQVTVTHRAGDPVAPDRLTLRAAGEPTDRQFGDVVDRVEPGDSVTVSVSEDATLRVVWVLESSRSTLATYGPSDR